MPVVLLPVTPLPVEPLLDFELLDLDEPELFCPPPPPPPFAVTSEIRSESTVRHRLKRRDGSMTKDGNDTSGWLLARLLNLREKGGKEPVMAHQHNIAPPLLQYKLLFIWNTLQRVVRPLTETPKRGHLWAQCAVL